MLMKLLVWGALFFSIAILPWLFIRQLSMMTASVFWWFWPWFFLLAASVATPLILWKAS